MKYTCLHVALQDENKSIITSRTSASGHLQHSYCWSL